MSDFDDNSDEDDEFYFFDDETDKVKINLEKTSINLNNLN
jgi:hypothetical protein